MKRDIAGRVALLCFVPVVSTAAVSAQDKFNNAALARIPRRDNQVILRASGGYGTPITVYVNGQQVDSKPVIYWTDITAYCKPGENTVRAVQSRRMGSVEISHAPTAGKFRRLLRYAINPVTGGKTDSTFTFTLPGSALDEAQGKSPVSGSASRQVILRSALIRPAVVYLNGKRVGTVQVNNNLDVGNLVRPGENELRIVWAQSGTIGNVKVAYANTKNKFRDIARIGVIPQESRQPGEKTTTFRFDPNQP
ncbi:MAG: hypothetical protein SFU56_10995 [Capsulimonadales bacterium]|nr:hypothetical protein [Capsulimonadales bacterium]